FFAFRIAEPYAFLGPAVWSLRLNPQWFSDKLYWAEVSSGTIDVPFMIVWANTSAYAFVLQAIAQWGMGPALGVAGLVGTALTAGWALAFSHGIYDQPHSRVQASDWIYANIPAGSTLATEHWDDRLPLARPGQDPGKFKYTELALYDQETPAKRTKLEGVLDQ